jgi:tetratricopeptide (TPR) repeat protein
MSRKQAFPAAAHALRVADSLLAAAAAADTNWSEPRLARGWTTYGRAILLPDSLTPLLDAALAIAGVEVARSSGSPMALELRGWLRYRKWQLILRRAGTALRDSAESDVFRATALDPGLARAWVVLSLSLQDRGDNAGATDAARRAIAADPYLRDVAPSFSRLVFSHLNAERYDSARALCAVAASRFSDDLTVRSCILTVLGWSGQGTRDIREAANALARDEAEPITGAALPGGVVPVSRFLYAAVLARSGLIDSAAAVIAATRAATQSVGRGDDFLVNEAFVWTVLARRDTALALLTKLVAASPQMRSRIAAHPWFAPLKNDPRFAALTAAP